MCKSMYMSVTNLYVFVTQYLILNIYLDSFHNSMYFQLLYYYWPLKSKILRGVIN